MTQFIIGVIVLIVGYFTYGKFIDKLFGADENRETPAFSMQDGVDYVPLPTWKVFLIQVLNVIGLGPIFGGVQGALFGSSAFIWIALGCVFAGAVHDYFSGMMSVRSYGSSISEVAGDYLGYSARQIMRVFSVILLILTGTVFMTGPADILRVQGFLGIKSFKVWLIIIFAYYILATIISIDKIIGKIYPILGIALLVMAIGVGGGLIIKGYHMPAFSFANTHPNPGKFPIWAMLFTTIACGAISGFHSTQSPMMARCIKNEKYGHRIFYGAMITEGIIAMVWASAASAYFHGGISGLSTALTHYTPAKIVSDISYGIMGPIGGALAILGVVACPITSGDTAFRAVRLTIADALKFDQRIIKNRLVIAIPLFVFVYFLAGVNFGMIWRYFAFSNQTLAAIVLWTATAFLINHNKNPLFTYLPAIFMTFVCSTYILEAPEGFRLGAKVGTIAGLIVGALLSIFMTLVVRKAKGKNIVLTKPKKL